MLLKLILLCGGIWLVYRFFRGNGKHQQQPQTPVIEEDMVRCIHCGVHQPKSESILSGGEFFCSQEHRRLRQGKE
jgi:uncharacterized protein